MHPDDPGLSPIERRLRGWNPDTAGLDRDRLLYEAGRASMPRRSPRWPYAVAAGLALAPALGWWWESGRRRDAEAALALIRDQPGPATTSVLVTVPTLPSEARPLDPSSYLALRRDFVRPAARTVGEGDGVNVTPRADFPDAGDVLTPRPLRAGDPFPLF